MGRSPRARFGFGVVLLMATMTPPAFAAGGEPAVVGLWRFEGEIRDATGSGSPFSRWSRSGVSYEEARVGTGSYAAVHGPEIRTDWRHEATGRLRLVGHAAIDGARAFGLAMWVRPVKVWSEHGRLISFGKDAFSIAEVPGDPPGRFRLADTGFVDASASPSFVLPFDVWSHLAITADGQTVQVVVNGEAVVTVPQRGALNASDSLYLGARWGGVGLVSAYFDELVIVKGAADAAWARRIYDVTRNGEPLPYQAPAPPAFEPVQRDASRFLRIQPQAARLAAGEAGAVLFEARETPLFGPYVAPSRLATQAEVGQVIADLVAHHCNTVVLAYRWCIERPALLRMFHDANFRVFALVPPPYGRDLVRDAPDTARHDEEGNRLPEASFYDARYIAYLRETFLAEGVEGRGIDGVILDEPAMPGWHEALRTGNLYHAHPAEQAAYRRMFGEPYPDLDLPSDRSTRAFEQVVAFRRRMMQDWFELVAEVAASRGADAIYGVALTPDTVSHHRLDTGLTAAEATAADVPTLLKSGWLDAIQVTAYLNAWNQEPQWLRRFLPLFAEAAHDHEKASIFWAQAYLESPTQVQRGIQRGHIGETIGLTLSAGVDGVFIWHYQGFSGDGYGWDDYFEEFAGAVETWRDRPAQGLRFELADAPGDLIWRVQELGDGRYTLSMNPARPGAYRLRVRNRVGVERTVAITVGAAQESEE